MGLEEAFIQKCRESFNSFDIDGSGSIDTQEMKLLLESIGEPLTEEEVFQFMAEVDEDQTGEIEFPEFIRAFEKQLAGGGKIDNEREVTDSFVAFGGNRDKTGSIDSAKLIKVVREDFGMAVRIDKVLEVLDTDKDGSIDYNEFSTIFS